MIAAVLRIQKKNRFLCVEAIEKDTHKEQKIREYYSASLTVDSKQNSFFFRSYALEYVCVCVLTK